MDAEEITYRKLGEKTAGETWPAIEIAWTFSSGSTRKITRAEFVLKETKDCDTIIETLATDGTSPGITIPNANALRVIISAHTPTLANRNWTHIGALRVTYDDGNTWTKHILEIPIKKSIF